METQSFARSLNSEVQFKQIIRDLGLKVTSQRLVILKTLIEGRAHVTAQEVYETIVISSPEIGFATVYRFLKSLSENGFVKEIRIGGQPARYEWGKKEHHDHMTCTKCKRICEFENQEIERLQKQVAQNLGFKLTDHVLELFGLCPQCQEVSPSMDPLASH